MTELLTIRDTAITLKHPDRLFINGEWVLPKGGSTLEVIDATTEEAFYRTAETTPSDMDAAIAAARDAFDNSPWPFLEPSERADYLRRIARPPARARRGGCDLLDPADRTHLAHVARLDLARPRPVRVLRRPRRHLPVGRRRTPPSSPRSAPS